jgi:hypothetical protein
MQFVFGLLSLAVLAEFRVSDRDFLNSIEALLGAASLGFFSLRQKFIEGMKNQT